MSANQVEKEVMLAEWARDAKACKSSGMTVKDWCASKGLNINTYRYRCRRLRMAAEEGLTVQQDTGKKIPSFVPVPASIQDFREAEAPIPSSEVIRLRLGSRTLELPVSISPEYFQIALEVFAHAE